MKIEEIKKLIIKGEGISLEFKEAREALPESFFEAVCAFSAFLLHPEIIDYRGQKLISVLVPASSQVHRCNGKVFDRSVDGDFEVKADEAM